MLPRPSALLIAVLCSVVPPGGVQAQVAQGSAQPAGTAYSALTIVAPAAPGGGWDQTARAMQHALGASGLATSVQVVNAPGAAGTIGLARFVSADRGNPSALLITGLVMVSGIATNHSPVTLADVTPIARLSGEYEVIVVPASSPYRSLADLIAAFKANPRGISWGGGSAGGTDEILARLLADQVGVARDGVNYIAYSGGGQALAAVLGAHVTAGVSGVGEFASQIEAGALRALAVSAPERVPGLNIPTFHEQGVNVTLLNWRGVVAPPGITRSERARLESLITAMAASAEWKAALARGGWADLTLVGEPFGRFLASETARVAPLVTGGRTAGRDWFAFVILGALGAAVLVAAVQWLRARGGAQQSIHNRRALMIVAAAIAANAALTRPLGFIVAGVAAFMLVAYAFGSRRVLRDALVGGAIAGIIYVAFTRLLGVSLPAGPFG
jgi:putative tricarboxylic transport membrane protein